MKNFLMYMVMVVLLTGCVMVGINMNHKTPASATRYPKFSEKDSLRGALSEYRSNYDVTYCALMVDFNLKKQSIEGKATLVFKAVKDLNIIQMDLHDKMSIKSIECNGQSLQVERKYNSLFIDFNRTIEKDEVVEFSITYEGKPMPAKKPPWDGGFVWKKEDGKPWIGVACEKLGAHIWWPVKDHLSDEPDSMDLHYTIPEGLFCVANGKLISQNSHEGRTTFHWKVSNPINSYNVTFYIGDYVKVEQPYEGIDGKHTLEYYVLPKDKLRAMKHFQQTADILRFFEDRFGVYPWWEDGFKLVSSPYAGMEHQSAIAYGNGYEKNKLLSQYDYIILHEAAHEWWGNSITVSDFADIWIQEGFATYCEALYIEHADGKAASDKYLWFYSLFVRNKAPMVGPMEVNYWDYKDGDPYMKGALTLHSLRNTLGNDSIFFSILRGFYQENAKQIVTSQQFVEYVQKISGRDLNWFFDQFLHSRKAPKFTYYRKTSKKGSKALHYKWTDVVEGFKMPIKIKINNEMVTLIPTTEEQVYEYPDKGIDIYIDPYSFYFTNEEKRF